MINVMDVKITINEDDKCLDSELWHACAGCKVPLPALNSKVFYFPEGHAEHAALGNVNFGDYRRIPSYILCLISSIKFMADTDTDEVYARIGLLPVRNHNDFNSDSDGILGLDQNNQDPEKPPSFAKTLTQSDANNGGGFSVPRFCAESIFPRLDFTADPPVQTLIAKDVHGRVWKFRHIYRGTPRRHLLTTGWSNFVNNKKLIAGDSIVFLRSSNGELRVGVRRARKGIQGNNDAFLRNPIEKFNNETMIEAVKMAASGQPFEVFYYPGAGTPEFIVKASTVMNAMRIHWCPGMKIRMNLEGDDPLRTSCFMGTVSSIHVNDQSGWPSSPWRLLQVTWDEPELLQNVKRVNPWSIEPEPSIHLPPSYSQQKKKARILQPPDFLNQPPPLTAINHHLTSIQGARHYYNSQFPQNNQFINTHFPLEVSNQNPSRTLFPPTKETDQNVSCLLEIGNTKKNDDNNDDEKDKKKPVFVLFGQPILTAQQLSDSGSGDVAPNVSDASVVLQNGPVETSSDEAGPSSKQQESSRCEVVQKLDNPSVNS